MNKITKIRFKESERIIKLFNNNLHDKIWKEVKKDFENYTWDSAEIHIKNDNIYILFSNFKKKVE